MKRLLNLLKAAAFLDTLGKCQLPTCPSPDLAVAKRHLFVCGCGCGRDMHRSCVIKHNLEISRQLQVSNSWERIMKERAA